MPRQPVALRPAPTRTAIKPIENLTLREQVASSVRTALMNGHFQPGQPVTVRAISAMLGASVMPVREAMNRLIAEGALELRPNRSVIVPRLSREEFDELTDLRCHVEGLAAARAAGRVGAGDLTQLRAIDDAMRAAAAAADADAYLDKNFEFHFLVYRLGASRFTLAMIENLWVRAGPLIRYCLSDGGFAHPGRMHAQLIHGLDSRDPALLRAAVRSDITNAAKVIRRVCESMSLWP